MEIIFIIFVSFLICNKNIWKPHKIYIRNKEYYFSRIKFILNLIIITLNIKKLN